MLNDDKYKSLNSAVAEIVSKGEDLRAKQLQEQYGKYIESESQTANEEYEFLYVELDEEEELIGFILDEEEIQIDEKNDRAKQLKKAFRAGRAAGDSYYGVGSGRVGHKDGEPKRGDKAAKAAYDAGKKSSDVRDGKTTGQRFAKGSDTMSKPKAQGLTGKRVRVMDKPNLPKDIQKSKTGTGKIAVDQGGKRAVVSHSGSVNVQSIRDKIKKFNKDQKAAGRPGVKIQFFNRKDGGKIYVTSDDAGAVKRAAGMI